MITTEILLKRGSILVLFVLFFQRITYGDQFVLPPPNMTENTSIEEIPKPYVTKRAYGGFSTGIFTLETNEPQSYFTSGFNFSLLGELYLLKYFSVSLYLDIVLIRRSYEYDEREGYMTGAGGGLGLIFHIPITPSQSVIFSFSDRIWGTVKILTNIFLFEGGYQFLNKILRVSIGIGGMTLWDTNEHDRDYYEYSGESVAIITFSLAIFIGTVQD